jgi:aromatic ring-cleaving dioxygenase
MAKPVRKPKRRNAWLITWEFARQDYFDDLNRPRVVAILDPRLSSATIMRILPVLFASEKQTTFTAKMGYTHLKPPTDWLRHDFNGRISTGGHPWLEARVVKDLWIEDYADDIHHQTLHWTEYERYAPDAQTGDPVVVHPAQDRSEDAHFDQLWYGRSLLEEDRRAGLID